MNKIVTGFSGKVDIMKFSDFVKQENTAYMEG